MTDRIRIAPADPPPRGCAFDIYDGERFLAGVRHHPIGKALPWLAEWEPVVRPDAGMARFPSQGAAARCAVAKARYFLKEKGKGQ